MITARTVGLTLCLALPPLSAAPGPRQGDPGGRITQAQVRETHIERMNDEIQGLWKIRRLRTGPDVFEGAQFVGYMLVAPDHLSLEFHIEEFSKDRGLEGIDLLFQSGVHDWRFTSLAELELVSLIGTDGTSGKGPEFEPPGRKRIFRFELGKDRMSLQRGSMKMDLHRISRPEHTLPQTEEEAAGEQRGG